MDKHKQWELLEEYFYKHHGDFAFMDFDFLSDEFILHIESSCGFTLYKFRYRCKEIIKFLFSKVKIYFFCDHIFIADFTSAIRQRIPAIGGKLICNKCHKSFEYRFIIYK
jgi:hypothetical protein